MPRRLLILEDGRDLAFSFREMLKYNGGQSPGGVAHAFKVLERGLPLLSNSVGVDRRGLVIATAFGGPGARDAFELVTRAVSDGRFSIDPSLARPELGLARERFIFRLRYGEAEVFLTLREGFVGNEFIELARRPGRSREEEDRLTDMKAEMAARVMAARASQVYDVG